MTWLVVVCLKSTTSGAGISVTFSVTVSPGDQEVLDVYAAGDGVCLEIVRLVVVVTSGGGTGAVVVVTGEGPVGETTVVVFFAVVGCSEAGEAGTAEVVVVLVVVVGYV